MTTDSVDDRYALNLSLPPLRDHALVPRIDAAAAAGFSLVETWWPFPTAHPTRQQTEDLRTALTAAGTRLVCMNIAAGDFTAGERGILSDPDRRQLCRDSIVAAVEFAAEAGCRLLNLPYGNRLPDHSESAQHRTAFDNLLFAARCARARGISVLVEALNPTDNPLYLLPDVEDAVDVVRRARQAGALNTGILLDVYHVARRGQDPSQAIARYAKECLHVQFADIPDRTCPGTGGLDFVRIITALREVAYEGLIGLEFTFGPEFPGSPADARSFASRHSFANVSGETAPSGCGGRAGLDPRVHPSGHHGPSRRTSSGHDAGGRNAGR
ncbi:TIM barrel protein [Streptomyces sp. GMY02]|uniref:TIM barrel protein n=1 Tax=Streptomyces sp. GMY02 TaxID=1333528 RepID=UPI001C2B9895|nr:TIM barrel protein [Streptomyces sp. GMY02]QXE33766.1 TIM barrel protein [Streptomyces sp. GMY02]